MARRRLPEQALHELARSVFVVRGGLEVVDRPKHYGSAGSCQRRGPVGPFMKPPSSGCAPNLAGRTPASLEARTRRAGAARHLVAASDEGSHATEEERPGLGL